MRVIVLMLWFYLSGFVLLVGAELNAEVDRAVASQHGAVQPSAGRKRIGPGARE